MKQVWVNFATCSRTASTTAGALLPTVVTAMPEPRSMNELPSTSTTTPPPAPAAYTGMMLPTALDTAAERRAASSASAAGHLGDQAAHLGQRRSAEIGDGGGGHGNP